MELVQNRMDVGVIEVPSQKEATSHATGGEVMIVLLNDNDTNMNFVVSVLGSIFSLDSSQSEETMMMAHTSGSAVIGYYSEKQAVDLLKQVDSKNSQSGNHLRCLMVDM